VGLVGLVGSSVLPSPQAAKPIAMPIASSAASKPKSSLFFIKDSLSLFEGSCELSFEKILNFLKKCLLGEKLRGLMTGLWNNL
jgi:hypothetical protein